jgi:DNA-binding NarL/FixJ family response regulator
MLSHPSTGTTLNLSAREIQVLDLIGEGYSNPEIAKRLCISISTVKTHVRNIMNKFGVDRRIQAVVLAVRSGLI